MPISSLQTVEYKNEHKVLLLSVILTLFGQFFPEIARILLLASLAVLGFKRSYRLYLSIPCTLFPAGWAASRQFGSPSDDVYNYYFLIFQFFKSDPIMPIFYFGGGAEFGFGAFLKFLFLINENATPQFLVFSFTILLYLLIIFVYEYKGSKLLDSYDTGIALSLLLLFPTLSIEITNILRQNISSVFLILAIFCRGKLSVIWLIISSIFHLSAIPIYSLLLICKQLVTNRSLIKTFIFAGGVLGAGFFIIFYLGQDALNRFYYYQESQGAGLFEHARTLFFLSILASFSVINCIDKKVDHEKKSWSILVLIFWVIYLLISPLPHASLRVTYSFVIIWYGYLLAYLWPKKYRIILNLFYILLLLDSVRNSIFSYGDFELWSTYDFGGNFGYFWTSL
jgi:hypothetical protein